MINPKVKVKIADLKAGMQGLDLVGNIVSIQKRELKNERGESVYYYGIIGDETGTISFTAWMFPSTVRAGDVVEIRKASVREYKGVNRLYIDSGSEVIMRPGDTVQVKRSYSQMKIRDVSTSQPFVTIEGKITGVRQKELERDGKKLTIYYGDLEDDTGRIRVSSFDRPLSEGEFIRIEGARVSEYNGRYRLTLGNRTTVTPIKQSVTIQERIYDIQEIKSPIGGVTLNGFIVSVGPKSGLVIRCSVCNNRLDDIHCPDHPESPIKYDLFVYFTMDDGTGSIQCTGGRSVFLDQIGFSEDEFNSSNKKVSRRTVSGLIQERLLGRAVVARGDISKGQGGFTLRLSSIVDVDDEFLKKLTVRMGADFQ